MKSEESVKAYTNEELVRQKQALEEWIRVLCLEGGSPTLMMQALDMINGEIKKRKDEKSTKV